MYIVLDGNGIPPYGLCMALAFLLAIVLTIYRGQFRAVSMEEILVVDAMALGGALIGAKLLYVFVTYSPKVLWMLIKNGNWSFVSESGFVYLGGLLLGALGAWLGIKLTKGAVSCYEDVLLPVLPFVHALGRGGCLLAGCCHGREYEGLGAIYYVKVANGVSVCKGYFPIQAVEAIGNIILGILLVVYTGKPHQRYGAIRWYLVGYGILRFVLEFFRGDVNRGEYGIFSTSQWICCFLLGAVLFGEILRRVSDKSREKKSLL